MKHQCGIQGNLFKSTEDSLHQPLVVAYGLGVDSTAVLVELQKRGIRPDAILFADTGNEKKETYDYLPVINGWLAAVGFPQITVVRYQPKDFKDYPQYTTLGENCMTYGTLPSLAYGRKSCSLKWKVAPQNSWTDSWLPAVDYWKAGGKVLKIIGYDASKKDMKRYAHVRDMEDAKYQYWYPLIDWGMDREACKESIRRAGLPVPAKSACIFCPATQPAELREFSPEDLSYIILLEARATPNLRGCMNAQDLQADFNRRHQIWQAKVRQAKGERLIKLLKDEPRMAPVGSGCAGLWRSATKTRPAKMTDFIRSEKLLTESEIEALQNLAQTEIDQKLQQYSCGESSFNWHDLISMLTAEYGTQEGCGALGKCIC